MESGAPSCMTSHELWRETVLTIPNSVREKFQLRHDHEPTFESFSSLARTPHFLKQWTALAEVRQGS